MWGMVDGSGHDYASDDEHLSLSTVLRLFNAILGDLVHLHPNKASLSSNAGQRRRELHLTYTLLCS